MAAAVSRLAVAALIRRGDEILLVRQQGPDDPEPTWGLPGGVVEQGELLHEALVREVREETGLEVDGPVRLLLACQAVHRLSAIGFAPMREPMVRHLLGETDVPMVWLWPHGVDGAPVVIPPLVDG